jgi:carbohydrate binding protein with CBM4/9 domain
MRTGCLCAALCIASLGAAPAVRGANLLSNPNFDTDLTGWYGDGTGTFEWSPDDQGGNSASGSAHAVSPGPGLAAIDHECIPIEGATTYAGRAWVRVNAGNINTRLLLGTYSNPNCFYTGYLGSQSASSDSQGTEQWEHLVGQVTTPASAQSAILSCSFGGGAVDGKCDAVSLPEAADGGGWALGSLAGLALMRRRAARSGA